MLDLTVHEGQGHPLLPVDKELFVLTDRRVRLCGYPRPGHTGDPGLG